MLYLQLNLTLKNQSEGVVVSSLTHLNCTLIIYSDVLPMHSRVCLNLNPV